MHGLFLACGPAARELSEDDIRRAFRQSGSADLHLARLGDEVLAVRLAPKSRRMQDFVYSDERFEILIDDYLIVDAAVAQDEQPGALARLIHDLGIEGGLGRVVSGSFNLVVLDKTRRTCHLVTDPVGSIPLYHAKLPQGDLFSTSPVSLAATGPIDREADRTACAELALFGFPVGDRHFLRGIRSFPPATMWSRSSESETSGAASVGFDPYRLLPSPGLPDSGRIAERVDAACERLRGLGRRVAHLQSAGMDSRLILAAWPEGSNPPCYTYGDSASSEVAVARAVTELRGSEFRRSTPDGDTVADCLDGMFGAAGLLVFPDRYVVARKIAEDGLEMLLDGYLGGVLLDGRFYTNDRYFSKRSRLARVAVKLVDQRVSKVGLDAITEAMIEDTLEVRDPQRLRGFVSDDFLALVAAEKDNIRQDVHRELARLRPENDSVALLFRNYKMFHRCKHAVSQQGVMCRDFLTVAMPLSNDFDVLSACLEIRPEATAYHHFYIELFRRHYPRYAELPYGGSMLPLSRSPMSHKLSKYLLAWGLPVPGLTGKALGDLSTPSNWSVWLRTSAKLRDKAAAILREGGIHDSERLEAKLARISRGEERGTGKLLHLAAISRWIGLSGRGQPAQGRGRSLP